jgi:hypothetical protein
MKKRSDKEMKNKKKSKRSLLRSSLPQITKSKMMTKWNGIGMERTTIERLLLGLRRIDSHDCLLRHVCQINQNWLAGVGTPVEEAMLEIFRSTGTGSNDLGSIWRVYQEALGASVVDCGMKYQACPLTTEETNPANLLNGIF